MLRTLKDLNTIKSNNFQRNKSAKNMKTNTIAASDLKQQNSQENNNININNSKIQENQEVSQKMKKKLKYQLNYEEWLAIKEKQDEILFKWKEANSQENKNIELINGKINEEYEQIKKENFIKWLKKKQENQLKKQVNERKKLDEEMKKKEEKEQDKQRKNGRMVQASSSEN